MLDFRFKRQTFISEDSGPILVRFMKVCVICGDEFNPNHPLQKYCSRSCAKMAQKRQVKKLYGTLKKRVEKILGINCIICDSPKRYYHEIRGKPHKNNNYRYIMEHIEDFVPICYTCHRCLHYILNLDRKNYKNFLELLIKARRNNYV